VIVLVIVAALGAGAFFWVASIQDERIAATEGDPWFAGYADITATPTYAMESATADGTENVVLAFVVAAEAGGCVPTWGGVYTLDSAMRDLDLDRRLARIHDQGREYVISFGGQRGTELATACTTEPSLLTAYRTVIDRYETPVVDFDLEGATLDDVAAMERRASVVATLQEEREDTDEPLAVWLTLPVTVDGLAPSGAVAVKTFLDAGVEVTGVNVMTMDYGTLEPGADMAAAAQSALEGTHRQLTALYADAGTPLGPRALWRKIGATPMIGQNDIVGEVFTIADAEKLNRFADSVGLGRLSMWSLNRDAQCSPNYPDTTVVSDSCSGVPQGDARFAAILSAGRDGSVSLAVDASPATSTPQPDDPETSPYPIWSPDASYPADTRVVWRGTVYIAKWWNEGSQPDDPTIDSASSPWRLIGPVLPGETPEARPVLPEGFYPAWDPSSIYTTGERVLDDGIAFEARWWNQAMSPESALVDPGSSPWRRLDDLEILDLLGQLDQDAGQTDPAG
jgi:chitinase